MVLILPHHTPMRLRQELVADRTRSGLWAMGADNFPGSLLIRLGLGRDAVARHNPWEEMFKVSQVIKRDHELSTRGLVEHGPCTCTRLVMARSVGHYGRWGVYSGHAWP